MRRLSSRLLICIGATATLLGCQGLLPGATGGDTTVETVFIRTSEAGYPVICRDVTEEACDSLAQIVADHAAPGAVIRAVEVAAGSWGVVCLASSMAESLTSCEVMPLRKEP